MKGERLAFLKKQFPAAKLWFYDYEVPLNLPENATDPRYGVSPFLRKTSRWDMLDGLIIPSKGAAKRVLELTRVAKVVTLYFSVDPQFYQPRSPGPATQSHDLCFMGKSRYYREKEVAYMLDVPVKEKGYTSLDLSDGAFDIAQFIENARRSRVNLSITRRPFADCYASSVSRPFELAAMGCCVVSNPCEGIDEWFEPGKEVEVISDASEAVALYDDLLSDPDRRSRMGKSAQDRVLSQHNVLLRGRGLLRDLGFSLSS
jgi:hypothetical protein